MIANKGDMRRRVHDHRTPHAAGRRCSRALGTPAWAQAGGNAQIIRVGVLTDLSGPYRDLAGPHSAACVRQAVQEFTAGRDTKVEVLGADFQNSPDVGTTIARQWFDQQDVVVVVDVLNSAVALAVSNIAREKNKVALICAATTALTGRQCSPNTVHCRLRAGRSGISTSLLRPRLPNRRSDRSTRATAHWCIPERRNRLDGCYARLRRRAGRYRSAMLPEAAIIHS